MAVYPNTSNFKPTTVTDLSLKYDNDVTFSTILGGVFTTSSNNTFNTKIFKAFTYTGWLQTATTDDIFKVFHDVPGSGYIQDVSDPGNNVLNIYSGSTAIDRGFVAPHSGLFRFSLREKGYAIGNPIDKKGGFLSFQIAAYPSSSITEGTYSGTNRVLYETSQIPLIYTSSRYNYKLKTQGNSINSIQYSDTGDFQLSTIGTPLPFNTKTQDNANLFSSSFYSVDGSSHYLTPVPRSGSYSFDVRIEGSANITTLVTTPTGYQGTFTTPNKTITATLILKKRDSGGTFTEEYTETQNITVGGVSITDPNPGANPFTDISNFDLDSIFDVTDFSIDLDENESLIAFIKLTTPNGSGTQTFTETIGGIPGFSLQLTNNFFRLNNTSFLKLDSYTPSSENIQYIDYLIEEDNIELSLTKGDALTVFGRVQAIVSESGVQYPNSSIEGTTLPGMEISDIYLSTDNYFKGTFASTNNFSSGPYLGQPNTDGRDHYQPIEGSFLVDVSDIQASVTHPVLVTIPLHGFTKYVHLPLQETKQFNRPNNRRFLNNSVEIQLSTFSNKDQGLFSTGKLHPTHEVLQANFMHLNRDSFVTTHNSALLARFDNFGQGYTNEDLVENFPYLEGVGVFEFDDITTDTGSINNIYEGGSITGMPEGAQIKPQIFMTVGQNPFTKDNELVVFASPSCHPTQQQFYSSVEYTGTNPLNSTTEGAPGLFGWFKNYNFYTGSLAYDISNATDSIEFILTEHGFLNLNSAQFAGTNFTTVEGSIVGYPKAPTSLPIYFDRVVYDPSSNWYTSSESPAQNLFIPPNTTSPSLPDKSIYGNLRGPDVYPFVRNYYEVPEDGFYTISYNLNLIAEAAGGYGGVAGFDGRDIVRFLNFNNNTMNEFLGASYPLAYSSYYDGPLAGGAYNFKLNNSANTLYGKIVRVPTTVKVTGDVPQNPRTLFTSSLFRTDDYIGTHVMPIGLDYYGVNIGIGTAYVNNDGVSISMIGLGSTPDQDVFITNTGLVQNTDTLPQTDLIWESHYSSTPLLNPQYTANDFDSPTLYQDYLNALNPQGSFSSEHSSIRWYYSGQCQELYFYNENNQLTVATYDDFFGNESLEPTTYQQSFLELLMRDLDLSPEEVLYGLQDGFSSVIGNGFYIDNSSLTLTAADGTIAFQDLGDGQFYTEDPSLLNVNSLLSGLDNWNVDVGENDGVIWIDDSDGIDETELNAIVNAVNEKLDLYAWAFRTPGTGTPNSWFFPDMIYGDQFTAVSPPPENYPPERVSLPINDKKAVYLYKGDRIHLEVGLGPILPSGSYNWNDAENIYGNTGPYSKLSSVGRIYVGPESFLSIAPIKGGTALQPHLQFVLTGNNSNTIVKGTYKFF